MGAALQTVQFCLKFKEGSLRKPPSEDFGFFKLKPSNENIKRTLRLVRAMILLADKGDEQREDVGCGVLYGIMRDAAYKLKKAAEAEKAAHTKKGEWP